MSKRHIRSLTKVSPLASEISVLEQLDFRPWLAHEPPTHEAHFQLYQELTRQQDILLVLAKSALASSAQKCLMTEQFSAMEESMLDLDRLANRLIASYTSCV